MPLVKQDGQFCREIFRIGKGIKVGVNCAYLRDSA